MGTGPGEEAKRFCRGVGAGTKYTEDKFRIHRKVHAVESALWMHFTTNDVGNVVDSRKILIF